MIEQAKALLDTLAITFDFPVLEFIRNYLNNSFFDKVMPYISLFGEWGAFWIAIALILVLIPKTRKTGWSMGAALFLGLIICNVILKTLIARERPFYFYTVERMESLDLSLYPNLEKLLKNWTPVTESDIKWLVASDLHRCFPSGHTIASFESATVLMVKNKWAGIPATILAFLVAYSRLYLYVHYPTDVIFSIFAGILLGLLGCAIVAIIYKFRPRKHGKYERIKGKAA